MKMKAALMYGPNDIRVEMTEKPACPKDGLILKIMAVGLCGSDIRNLTSDLKKCLRHISSPCPLIHEGVLLFSTFSLIMKI